MSVWPKQTSYGIGPLNAMVYDLENQAALRKVIDESKEGLVSDHCRLRIMAGIRHLVVDSEDGEFCLVVQASSGRVVPDAGSLLWLTAEGRTAEEIIDVNNYLRDLLGLRAFDPVVDVWNPLR